MTLPYKPPPDKPPVAVCRRCGAGYELRYDLAGAAVFFKQYKTFHIEPSFCVCGALLADTVTVESKPKGAK